MNGALDGLLVLDLTRVLAGPYATMVLADLGADVIKVEMPGKGDDSREYGPYLHGESTYFMSLNRNKRSVTLNLKLEPAKKVFLDMIKKADILVENFRPGTMDRLGQTLDLCSGFGLWRQRTVQPPTCLCCHRAGDGWLNEYHQP